MPKSRKLKRISDLKRKDFFSLYKENNSNGVDKHTHWKFIECLFENIAQEMITTGWDFIMPYNLGVLGVRLVKPKIKVKEVKGKKVIIGASIDWGATIKHYREKYNMEDAPLREVQSFISNQKPEEKTIIKHFNTHTRGCHGELIYFKNYPGSRANYTGAVNRHFVTSRTFKWRMRDELNNNFENIKWDFKD